MTTASGPDPRGCPDCHRPSLCSARTMRSLGAVPTEADIIDCQRAQIARLTAALAEAEADAVALRGRLRARHASVESLLDQLSKAERRAAEATARAGEAALADLHKLISSMNWAPEHAGAIGCILDEIDARAAAIRTGGGR